MNLIKFEMKNKKLLAETWDFLKVRKAWWRLVAFANNPYDDFSWCNDCIQRKQCTITRSLCTVLIDGRVK